MRDHRCGHGSPAVPRWSCGSPSSRRAESWPTTCDPPPACRAPPEPEDVPMKQVLFRVGLATLVLAATAALAAAQATGAISGTARDQGGGVLPGVTVTATNTQTGATRVTVS